MDRRNFINRSGLAAGAILTPIGLKSGTTFNDSFNPHSWQSVRDQFILKHDHIQMAQMLLASHPRPVREAIEKHRKALDENTALYWEEKWIEQEERVAKAAADYMNVQPGEIALTSNTTHGLALLYNGLKLKPGDEVLQTTHDHYVTDQSLAYACEKIGAIHRKVEEYSDPASVSVDEVVGKLKQAITSQTRVLAVTWVHSCTGVKLPIKAIGAMVKEVNESRDPETRILFCVDGVHGFGNQDEDISSLGCDFFSAGTHKWIFGPRGTGILWGRKEAWSKVAPTIPAFRMYPFMKWMGESPETEKTFYEMLSPGGFYPYEHRWALDTAFEFQQSIGRKRVYERTTELNKTLKEGMTQIPHLKLFTPVDHTVSAGINCFEVAGFGPEELVHHLHEKGIIASSSPYKVSYARLTPCIINTKEEVVRCIQVLENI